MRAGIAFPHRAQAARAYAAPLLRRLGDLLVAPVSQAAVAVHAEIQPPVAGAWNVQLLQGVRGPFAATRRFLTRRDAFGLGRRRSRYQELNAVGRRAADRLARVAPDARIVRFGHPVLNEMGAVAADSAGPVLWLPSWQGRRAWGRRASGVAPFASEVARVARRVPFTVRLPPARPASAAERDARSLLAAAPGVEVAPAGADPYALLRGARGVLTDTSSLGFEAFALGFPVAVAKPVGLRAVGLQAELEERATVIHPGRPGLEAWAEAPDAPGSLAWGRDLLDPPDPRRNDAFAAHLRQRVVERASGRPW